MYHVKLQNKLTIKEIIIWFLIMVLLWYFLDKLFLSRTDYFILVGVVITGVLELIGNNFTYVSELIISPMYIEIVYCNQNKITDIVKIKRSDIQSFEVFANVREQAKKVTEMKGNIVIKTKTGQEINFSIFTNYLDIKFSQIFTSTIQPLINIAKMQNKFQFNNFSYEIKGSQYAILTVETYLKHGKKSYLQELKNTFNSSPEDAFRITFFILALCIMAITLIVFVTCILVIS